MQKPLITVVTSYYNDQDFLADAISSVLKQTYTNFEYILVNHASTDKSREIAHSFNDFRIKHIDLPINYGGSGNILIQKALEIAKGKYLKMLCADDVLLPNGLEILLKNAQGKNVDLLFGNVAFMDKNKKLLGKTWFKHRYPAHLSTEEYLNHFICGTSEFPYAGNFIKTDALKKISMDYVSIQLADVGLWVAMLFNGAKLDFTDNIVANYRIHPGQISSASKLQIIGMHCLFEHFLYYENYLNAKVPVSMCQKIFPADKYLAELDEDDKDILPFAFTHALYKATKISTCILACRLKLAEILNNDKLRHKIEKRFGYTIKNLREDVIHDPIYLSRISPKDIYGNLLVFKNASLKTLTYFFFRKLWFVITLKEWRHKRRVTKNGIV